MARRPTRGQEAARHAESGRKGGAAASTTSVPVADTTSAGYTGINVPKAFWAGVTGGAVISILFALVRLFGLRRAVWELWQGTFVLGLQPGPVAWTCGFLLHLTLSGLVALLYAWVFERITQRADAMTGLFCALPHNFVAGMTIGLLPALHPHLAGAVPLPGPFLASQGTIGVICFQAAHLLYGALVGALYAPARNTAWEE